MSSVSKAEALSRRFAALNPEQRQLFLKKLASAGVDFAALPITPAPRDGQDSPLSPGQTRLWFLSRFDSGSRAYHVSTTLRLTGALDSSALARALDALAERHEALRTTFHELPDGSVVQRVGAAAGVALSFRDFSAYPSDRAEALALQASHADAQVPFDLEAGPLVRAALVKLSSEEHILEVTLHHIVCDGWSMNVAIQELARAYDAYRAGRVPDWPALPLQYVDYAAWQHAYLDAGARELQLAYWKERLGSQGPVLDLPADRQRPAEQTYAGARHDLEITQPLLGELWGLVRRQRTTLPSLLLSVLKVLLYRYTGEADLRVGMTLANRQRSEVDGLMGFFVNNVVVRSEPRPNQTFESFLEQVGRAVLDAQSHQDLPFEQLVLALSPERSRSHNPLFQVAYDHQRSGLSLTPEMGGLGVQPVSRESRSTQFDLSLETRENGDRLHASFTFSTDLFEPDTIARLAAHWQNLLESVCMDPARPLAGLPLLSRQERQARLVSFRSGGVPAGLAQGYVSVFEERLERHSRRIAVAGGGERLSYAELDARANRVARALREHGVALDDVVVVLVPRNPRLLEILLGVLEAGAAYAPLDPAAPLARAARILDVCRPSAIVTTRELSGAIADALASLPEPRRPALVTLEDIEALPLAGERPRVRVSPRNRAYVIHTSGSTGVPKGAIVEHAGLLNNQLTKLPDLGLSESDVIAQTARQSFDISIWQFLTGLLCGARIEVIDDESARDPVRLLEAVEAAGVTVLQSVPAMIQAMLEARPRALPSLRMMISIGEALPPEVARRWIERYPKIRLLNAYGPAECSDVVSLQWIDEVPPGCLQLPIGRPIEHLRWYVLNAFSELAPVHVKGELCVSGVGVGRGYQGAPGLTAERFVPDPFATTPGERMYRTGDLVRYRRDGVVEFIGRRDGQVKIRGYRIELGEIEARIAEQPGVQQAAVVVRRDSERGARLVAYAQPESSRFAQPGSEDAVLFERELRRALVSALPDYMVPSQIVLLGELPTTAHGKVDRQRLPSEPPMAVAHVAPRDDIEEKLARIWSRVLGLGAVSIHDNFFELGGHSLLMTRVLSQVRELFKLELPLSALFEATTIAALGERVRSAEQAAAPSPETEELMNFLNELEQQ